MKKILLTHADSHLAACGIYASPQPSHRRGSVYFFGDLPPDSPTVPNRYPHLAFGGMNSPNFDSNTKYTGMLPQKCEANTLLTQTGITPSEKTTSIPTSGAGTSGVVHAAHPVYMGDSLGEGYFGGMEDLLGAGHSDEGEEFRNSLAHLQNTKFAGDSEVREERSMDASEKPEPRGDQEELRGTDERIIVESSKMELGSVSTINTLGRRTGDEVRSFPTPEDQGLIPGDLEHEFLLLRKKKFTGINIVQVQLCRCFRLVIQHTLTANIGECRTTHDDHSR